MREVLNKLESKYKLDTLMIDSDMDIYNYIAIYINDGVYKLPKKYDKEWIENKIIYHLSKNSLFKNLSNAVKRIISNESFIYPTSYGIGINIVFNSYKESQNRVLELLDKNNIEYRLEYSNAFWVMRIIISKTKTNLDRLEKITLIEG